MGWSLLDALFNDRVTIRRLSGVRDGHGKPTLVTVCEKTTKGEPTDVPIYVDCFVDRSRSMSRTVQQSTKLVDGTLYYNRSETPKDAIIRDEDLVVLESTGETYKATNVHEQNSAVEGSEYGVISLARVKFPVAKNAATSEEV